LFGSRGKVMHNDLLLLWVSAVFLLAPVEARLADREPSRAHGWPVRVATAVAATIYFLTGYHKLRRSGIDWAIGDNFRYIMLWGPTYGRPHWEAMAEWIGEHLWAARTSSTFLLGLELSFPLALVFRRLQWVWALAAAFVHIATWILLGLDYWAWTATVLLVFIDWPALADRLRGRPAAPPPAAFKRAWPPIAGLSARKGHKVGR
jgi:hypothetical protein